MKLNILAVVFCTLFFQLTACSEESTSNIGVDASKDIVIKEAIIEKTTLTSKSDPWYSDVISKFDASMNDTNIISLIHPQKQSFISVSSDEFKGTKGLEAFDENLERFNQSNITVAYRNFKSILDNAKCSDSCYALMAYKFAEMGLFSLSRASMDKIEDKDIWEKYLYSIKINYFPKKELELSEELFLADLNVAINYNNLTRESIVSIMDGERSLKRSDYANYLVSTAFFVEKDYQKALAAINRSTSINSTNFNYIILKAKILSELDKNQEALKALNSINSDDLLFATMIDEYDKTKAFLASKSEKNQLKAKYNLASYFYLTNDNLRALIELSSVTPKNKLPESTNLVADIYFNQKNYDKALEYYQKNVKTFKHYAPSYVGLGNISIANKDYKNAEKYYVKAYRYNKSIDALVNLSVLNFIDKDLSGAKDKCSEVLSKNSDYYKGYYLLAKYRPEKRVYNLKRAAAANPFYINTWLDLADNAILNNDPSLAQKYLDNVRFFSAKNSRYYYYMGVISRINSDEQIAQKYFSKATSLLSEENGHNIELLGVSEKKDF